MRKSWRFLISSGVAGGSSLLTPKRFSGTQSPPSSGSAPSPALDVWGAPIKTTSQPFTGASTDVLMSNIGGCDAQQSHVAPGTNFSYQWNAAHPEAAQPLSPPPTSASITVTLQRRDELLLTVGGVISQGAGFESLHTIKKRLSEEVLQELSETCGGLLTFIRSAPEFFDCKYTMDHVWTVRHSKRSPIDFQNLIFGTGAPPPIRSVRTKFVLPEMGLPLSAVARAEKMTPVQVLRIICSESPGAFTIYCDEIISERGDRLFPPDSPLRNEFTEEQLRNIYIVPGESTCILPPRSNLGPGAGFNRYANVHVPPQHELCRLARYVSGSRVTPFQSLRPLQGNEIYDKAIHIVLAYPKRFVVEPVSPSIETLEQITNIIAPPPGTVLKGVASPEYMSTFLAHSLKAIKGVRYVVQSPEALTDRARCAATEDVVVVQMALRKLNEDIGRGKVHFMRGKEERTRLMGKIWWCQNPKGSSLLDTDVLEQLIYDMLDQFPKKEAVTAHIRDAFWKCRFGKDHYILQDKQFFAFTELLKMQELKPSLYLISRRLEGEAASGLIRRRLTRHETVFEVLVSLPRPIIPDKFFDTSAFRTCCTLDVLEAVQQYFGSNLNFLKAFPKVFTLSVSAGMNQEFHTTEEKLDALISDVVRTMQGLESNGLSPKAQLELGRQRSKIYNRPSN